MVDTVIDPLNQRAPIVDGEGRPTQYFLRQWGNQYAVNGEANAEIQQILATQVITAGGLQGGAAIGAGDMTLSLTDTGVTAGVYGDAANIPQITVDEKGRITSAIDVPASGGGGGALSGWMYKNTTQGIGGASFVSVPYQVVEGDASGALSVPAGQLIVPAALAGRPLLLLTQSRTTTNPTGFYSLELWKTPAATGVPVVIGRVATDNSADGSLQVTFIDIAPATGDVYITQLFTGVTITLTGDTQNFFSYLSL